jgi:uncharacterized damage-inducible protein DinB
MEPSGEPTLIADERTQLEEFLEVNRSDLVATLRGLDDDQARRRLVPSLTTPLGLLKHAAFAERVWFHVALGGRTREELGMPADVDPTFELTEDDTVESVITTYEEVCAEAREIAARFALTDLARGNRRGPLTLRWIYLHMIEELARHAGHADILREQVLAGAAPGGQG